MSKSVTCKHSRCVAGEPPQLEAELADLASRKFLDVQRLMQRQTCGDLTALTGPAVNVSEPSMYEGLCEERQRFNWAFSTSASEDRVKQALLRGFHIAEVEGGDLAQLLKSIGRQVGLQ